MFIFGYLIMQFIVAMEKETGAIGLNGDMPWQSKKIKEDLAFFKSKTLGKHIVMGNKTVQGLIKNNIILKDRHVISLTKSPDNQEKNNGIQYCNLSDLIQLLHQLENHNHDNANEIVICGGKELYDLMMNNLELRKYLTLGYVSLIEFKQDKYKYDTDIKSFYHQVVNEAQDMNEDVIVDNDDYKLTIQTFYFT
jgi:dihydrofolate reductase